MESTLIGRRVLRYAQVTSTNDLAREHADAGEPEGLVVTAEEQTAGRGRLGRTWVAPAGKSLQLSALLRPPWPPVKSQILVPMAGLAITAALRRAYGFKPQLKWPNDVLLNGKKCAGILIETGLEGERMAYAIVGIGLNVNFAMRDYIALAPVATTVSDELGHLVDRGALEAELLACLNRYYAGLRAGEDPYPEWRAQLETLGRVVRATTPRGLEEGRAVDVTGDGSLIVERADGTRVTLVAGDVTLRDKNG